jgi:NADH:ubiquinone oxidoreductase subunit H
LLIILLFIFFLIYFIVTDGIKLILKEKIIPNNVNGFLFVLSPFFFFGISLLNWVIIPLNFGISISEFQGITVLFTIVLSEVSILGLLYAGYTSNSKYSLLGTLRAIAQMISYSVTMSLAIICILFTVGSIDYLTILDSQLSFPLFLTLLPVTIILIITCVAELGRFDLIKNLY